MIEVAGPNGCLLPFFVVEERHECLYALAGIVVLQCVCFRFLACDGLFVHPVSTNPAIGEAGVAQAFGIGDAGDVRCQGFAHPAFAMYQRNACCVSVWGEGWVTPRFQPGSYRCLRDSPKDQAN